MIFLRFMFTGTDLESQDYKGKKNVRYVRVILGLYLRNFLVRHYFFGVNIKQKGIPV